MHICYAHPLITIWPSELAAKLSIQLYLQHIDFHSSIFSSIFLFDLFHNYFQWLKNHVVKFRHNTNLALNIISFLFSQSFLFIKNLNPLWRCSKITQRCYITVQTHSSQSSWQSKPTIRNAVYYTYSTDTCTYIHTQTCMPVSTLYKRKQ